MTTGPAAAPAGVVVFSENPDVASELRKSLTRQGIKFILDSKVSGVERKAELPRR